MKYEDYKPIATSRVLIHGISGTGKSTLAAELAEHGFSLVWINIENAADTLAKLSAEAKSRINLVNLPDSASFPIAAQTCLTLFKSGKASICDAHGKHQCALCQKDPTATVTEIDFSLLGSKDIVVVDTGTQLAFSVMAYTVKDRPVEYRPERDDWGALRKYSEFFKSQFQAAKFNLIVVCQSQEAEIEDGIMKLVPSFGSSGMSAGFSSAFDHVVYTEIKNGKHRAYSKSTASNKFLTRSRSDFAIEDQKELTLSPVFLGKHPITETKKTTPTVQTPATKSITDLSAMLATMKGNK